MLRLISCAVTMLATTAPALAGTPAPVLGVGLSGLATVAFAVGGYAFLRFRRARKDRN
jgi:hypothetical protein